jgi:GR25 family glycosyltransferase involved in LPS biosynthesis
MDCVYINLYSRPDRRQSIEDNFSRIRTSGWTLSRFEAVDTAWVAQADVPGQVSPAEKACFVSHRNLIREHLASDASLMVLEDDTVFGAATCGLVDRDLARIPEAAWDILYTDVCIPDIGGWPELIRLRRQYEQTRALKLLGLGKTSFAGASSYILNRRSKRLLAGLLDEVRQINTPYDLFLRSLIQQGKLRAFVAFPFLTTVSPLANQSSIQPRDGAFLDRILNGFRRSVWVERDLDQAMAELASLRNTGDGREMSVFGTLFGAMLSDELQRR